MRRIGVSPKNEDIINKINSSNTWFTTITERGSLYSGAANPTAADVPENQWVIYRNTTIPEIRIWTNIAGTLFKSAAFT